LEQNLKNVLDVRISAMLMPDESGTDSPCDQLATYWNAVLLIDEVSK
jgi:hypothetical protein